MSKNLWPYSGHFHGYRPGTEGLEDRRAEWRGPLDENQDPGTWVTTSLGRSWEINSQTALSFLPLIAWSPLGEPKWNPGGKGILEKKVAHTEQGEKDGE